jgi:hypothetical protein
MKDPRHKAAVIRVREALRHDGVRLHNKMVDRIVAEALRDDTEHDVTRLGRHLREVTKEETS